MSTSDRVCQVHGDIGATPQTNFCPTCGERLVMKSLLRSAGETVVTGAAVGLGVGIGLEVADSIVDGLSDLF